MAASIQPQRSHLTSKFNSVTPITYVPMLIWPLNASSDSISPGEEEGGGLPSIDLRGFAAGKNIKPLPTSTLGKLLCHNVPSLGSQTHPSPRRNGILGILGIALSQIALMSRTERNLVLLT